MGLVSKNLQKIIKKSKILKKKIEKIWLIFQNFSKFFKFKNRKISKFFYG